MNRTMSNYSDTSPQDPTHPRASHFSTERLPLATYLHARGQLRFIGCKLRGPGKIQFEFEDGLGLANEMELAFECGEMVAATALFASQKFLRRKMTEILNTRSNGESNYGTYTQH